MKRFEAGANVSVDVVVRVAIVLQSEHELHSLFPMPDLRTLDEIIDGQRLPKRGRSR